MIGNDKLLIKAKTFGLLVQAGWKGSKMFNGELEKIMEAIGLVNGEVIGEINWRS